MRKKVLCVLLVGTMMLGLAACAKGTDEAKKLPEKTEESSEKTFANHAEKQEKETKKKGFNLSKLYADEPVEVQCINHGNKDQAEGGPEKRPEYATPEMYEPTEGTYTFSGLNLRKIVEYADSRIEEGMDPFTNLQEVLEECIRKEYGDYDLEIQEIEMRSDEIRFFIKLGYDGYDELYSHLNIFCGNTGRIDLSGSFTDLSSVELGIGGNIGVDFSGEELGAVDVILPTAEEAMKVIHELEHEQQLRMEEAMASYYGW